ncbi:MAG TPA: acyltransferase, partial [Bacteroidales bacterium]|nr:acyltransferase [Bacteroidales bacterium]
VLYSVLQDYREGSGMPPLWKFLTFTLNLGYDAQHTRSFSHAWSLCIEEQFYLLLPLALSLIFLLKFQHKAIYLILALLVGELFTRLFIWNTYIQPSETMGVGFVEKIYYPTYTRMDGLLIGIAIAAIWNYSSALKEFIIKYSNYFLLAGILLFVIAYPFCSTFISSNTAIYGFTLMSVAFGLMVMAAISPTCVIYKLKSKTTFVIATLSYSIYLSHKQIFHLFKDGIINIGIDPGSPWIFWICLVAACLGGLILYIVIEKPFFALRDKVLRNMSF